MKTKQEAIEKFRNNFAFGIPLDINRGSIFIKDSIEIADFIHEVWQSAYSCGKDNLRDYLYDMIDCKLGDFCSKHQAHDVVEYIKKSKYQLPEKDCSCHCHHNNG